MSSAVHLPPGRPAGLAFDGLASTYDASFTDTDLGRRLRRAVWQRLDRAFGPGDHVLELGCGTGVDAMHLAERGVRVLAIDASTAMVAATRARAQATGLRALVQAMAVPIEALDDIATPAPPFDGAFANFGGLNCVADLAAVAEQLGRLVRPGGAVVLCVMGPVVPWEWVLAMGHGQSREAFRRLRPAPWRGVELAYPTPRRLSIAFRPWFERTRTSSVNALLPPSEGAAWVARHRRLADRLERFERRVEAVPGLAGLADHYLIELQRRR